MDQTLSFSIWILTKKKGKKVRKIEENLIHA